MRKIIVVYGDSNTGKTTVIDQAYDKLLELGAECEIPRTALEILRQSCHIKT